MIEMKNIKLHKPTLKELWFRQKCMADPKTMAYNAGYDVSYEGYHRKSGCIDFPVEKWEAWKKEKLDNPNFFYAYILDLETNQFVGYCNFNKNIETNNATMGIVIKDEYRGNGYMRPAVTKMFEKAKECGVKTLTDTVPKNRERALKVFYDLGFQKTDEYVSKKFGKDEIVAKIEKKL